MSKEPTDGGTDQIPTPRLFVELLWGTGMEADGSECYECRAGCEWAVTVIEASRLHSAIDSQSWGLVRPIIESHSPTNSQDPIRRILDLALALTVSSGGTSQLGKVKPNLVVVRDAEPGYGIFRVQCEVVLTKAEFQGLTANVMPPRSTGSLQQAKTLVIAKTNPVTQHQQFRDILALAFDGQPIPGP